MNWYFDIPNVLACIIAIIIAWRIKIIPYWIACLLSIYSFIPFFLNDFLFPVNFMKDQLLYVKVLEAVRTFDLYPDHIINPDNVSPMTERLYSLFFKTVVPSWFYSVLPIPFVETVKSIGFFNRFLFLILFLWIYSKNFLSGLPLAFILFYPSLLFYTSLSLRDPLVLMFMIIGTISLVDKKYVNFFIILFPLYFIKFQNFFFMMVLFCIFFIFKKQKSNQRYYFLIFLLILCLIPFFDEIIYKLNNFRRGFWWENSVDKNLLPNDNMFNEFNPIDGIYGLITKSFIAFPSFFMRPLPWQAENIFQVIQSIENIFLLFFLIVFVKKAYRQNVLVANKWVLFLVITMTIHGLVVYNVGTSARYRFPFVVMFVIGLAYELYKVNGYRFKAIFKKKWY